MPVQVPPLRNQITEYSDIIGPSSVSLSECVDLLETASQGVCLVDRLNHVVACNDEFSQMLGVGFEELHGSRLNSVLSENEKLMRALNELWDSEQWEGELELHPEGSARLPVYLRGKPVPEETLDLAVLFVRDLLDRELSAASSQRERLVREAFFDAVSEGLFRVRLDQPAEVDWPEDLQREHILREARFVRCNEAGTRQFGMSSPAEIESETVRDVLPSVGYEIADRFVEAGFKLEGERMRVDCDGELRFFHLNIVGLDRGTGSVEEIWASSVDVTEQVRRETGFAKRLEERKQHVSRKLHDEVSPYLTGARIFAERIEEEYDQEQLELLKEYLEKARDHVAHVHRDLRPPAEGEPLGQIVADLVGQHDALGEMRCYYEGDVDAGSLDRETTAHLYRIVQESLRNAVRHSAADRVVVRVREENGILDVEIEDDGQGFDRTSLHGSSGLKNMQYRAEAIGADLEVESEPGTGTTVRCRVDTA